MSDTKRVDVFDEQGRDHGYIGDIEHWWFDPAFPHAFTIFDLDGFYGDPYFKQDHIQPGTATTYADHVLTYGEQLLGEPVGSLLELGAATGWFSEEFLRRGIDLIAIEGTRAGFRRLAQRIPSDRAIRHDVRLRLDLGRSFDVAVCTEVAEHIEPPFSSQLVDNLVRHAPVVWFSFASPGTNEAHYHHSNEQPLEFWVNLFAFYGYASLLLPEEVTASVEGRGRVVFYDRSRFGHEVKARQTAVRALGHTIASAQGSQWRRRIKLFVPPVVHAVRNRLRG